MSGTGKLLATLKGHKESVNCMSMLKNGLLASSSHDTIKIWNCSNKSLLHSLQAHTSDVLSMTVLSSNGHLISGSSPSISIKDPTTIKVWNTDTCDLVNEFKGCKERVTCMLVISKGDCLVSGSDKQPNICIWDSHSGGLISNLEGHSEPVSCLVELKNGYLVSCSSKESRIKIWDFENKLLVTELKGHEAGVHCLKVLDPRITTSVSFNFLNLILDWNKYTS